MRTLSVKNCSKMKAHTTSVYNNVTTVELVATCNLGVAKGGESSQSCS